MNLRIIIYYIYRLSAKNEYRKKVDNLCEFRELKVVLRVEGKRENIYFTLVGLQ